MATSPDNLPPDIEKGQLWPALKRFSDPTLLILSLTIGVYAVAYASQLGRFNYFGLPTQMIVIDFNACVQGLWSLALRASIIVIVVDFIYGPLLERWGFSMSRPYDAIKSVILICFSIGILFYAATGKWQFTLASLLLSIAAILIPFTVWVGSIVKSGNKPSMSVPLNPEFLDAADTRLSRRVLGVTPARALIGFSMVLLLAYLSEYWYARAARVRWINDSGQMLLCQAGPNFIMKKFDVSTGSLSPEITIAGLEEISKKPFKARSIESLKIVRIGTGWKEEHGIANRFETFEPDLPESSQTAAAPTAQKADEIALVTEPEKTQSATTTVTMDSFDYLNSGVKLGIAIFGSFAGAAFAFKFAKYSAKREERNKQLGTLLKVQLILANHVNSLLELKKLHQKYAIKDGHPTARMVFFAKDLDAIDITSISFLAESDAGQAEMVIEAQKAEKNYIGALAAIADRNALCERLLRNKESASQQDLLELKAFTDGVFDTLETAEKHNRKMCSLIGKVGKALFPSAMFFEIEPLDPNAEEK